MCKEVGICRNRQNAKIFTFIKPLQKHGTLRLREALSQVKSHGKEIMEFTREYYVKYLKMTREISTRRDAFTRKIPNLHEGLNDKHWLISKLSNIHARYHARCHAKMPCKLASSRLNQEIQ